MNLISTTDVARAAGISERTARRFLREHFATVEAGAWLRFEAAQLPELKALCLKNLKRRRMNRFNSVLKPDFAN